MMEWMILKKVVEEKGEEMKEELVLRENIVRMGKDRMKEK